MDGNRIWKINGLLIGVLTMVGGVCCVGDGCVMFWMKLGGIWNDLDEKHNVKSLALWFHGQPWTRGIDCDHLTVDHEHYVIFQPESWLFELSFMANRKTTVVSTVDRKPFHDQPKKLYSVNSKLCIIYNLILIGALWPSIWVVIFGLYMSQGRSLTLTHVATQSRV